jgi:colanic acid/amylovoran biosynthesis glycosyltransferase
MTAGSPGTRVIDAAAGRAVPRVIYLLYRYPQLSQTFVRDEVIALRRAGVRVDVVSLDDPGPDRPDTDWSGPYLEAGRATLRNAVQSLAWWALRRPRVTAELVVSAVREPKRRRYLLARVPALARQLDDGATCHVHTHFAWDTATVASAVAGLLAAPSSITVHAKDIYAQPIAVVRRRLSRFGRVVTVCTFNVGYLLGSRIIDGGAPAVDVIPCGVEIPPESPAVATVDVVAVGRLIEKKGFDVLLRALARLPALWEHATIVGDGPDRADLEALRDELGLTGHVEFTGALPHAAALQRIGEARVFCLPARPARDGDSDAMPVVIREAMARGVPVVASRLAGIPESVDEDVGWLVKPGAPESLAAALESALADPEERARRGHEARERAAQRWTFVQQVSDLLDVFAAGGRTP